LGIVSGERSFMEALAEALPNRKRDAWVAELAKAREAYVKKINEEYERGLKHSTSTEHLHPAVIGKEVHDFLYKGDIDPKQTVTGWGGWTIGTFIGRWLRAFRPAQELVCGYQYGAIGPDLAMTIGAGAAVQRGVGPQSAYKGAPVLCVTSDASTAYSIFELETAQKYQIPVITLVYNNNCWGTWPQASSSARSMHLYCFQENLRYDQIAQALGGHGEYVRTPEELRAALKRSYELASRDKMSTVINCQGLKAFTSARDYPPGVYINPEPGVGAFAH
jgi:thiamine pyrophosphate-dependent acetolactate synthase large subunit-like protein